MKKIIITFLVLSFWNAAFCNDYIFIVKANVIRGESMVTSNTNPVQVEKMFQEALRKLEQNKEIKKQLLVDIFIFQFPADYPTVAVSIRSENGIHYFDKERIKLFGDRNAANIKLVKKIISRLPNKLNMSQIYQLSLDDILSNRKSLSLIQLTSNAVTGSQRQNYRNAIDWGENDPPQFILDNFYEYLKYCMNFQGIRKKIKKQGGITLVVDITKEGRTKISNIKSPFELEAKQKARLTQAIAAIPLWYTESEINGIELKINLNR